MTVYLDLCKSNNQKAKIKWIWLLVMVLVNYCSGSIITTIPTTIPTDAPTFYPIAAPSSYLISAVAGTSGSSGHSGDSGKATSSQFLSPNGVFQDSSSGILYVADSGNGLVRQIDTNNIIMSMAGVYSGSGGGAIGPATSVNLQFPQSLFKNSLGQFFIVEQTGSRVRALSTSLIVSTIAGTGGQSSSSFDNNGDNGPATSAIFNNPAFIIGDSVGFLYISDLTNKRIRRFPAAGGIIVTVAGTGGNTFFPGYATSVAFNPLGIAIDTGGNLYVSDMYSNLVIKTTNSYFSPILGNAACTFNGDGQAGTSTSICYTMGLSLDSSYNLYFADANNYRVRWLTNSAGIVFTIGGTGVLGDSGNGGAATAAAMNPHNILGNTVGNIYVSSQSQFTVRRLDNLNPTVSPSMAPTQISAPTSYLVEWLAGSGIAGGLGDNGRATAAQLSSPRGVFQDTLGAVYIADSGNNVIRSVSSQIITTFAGLGSASSAGDGGPVSSCTFSYPTDIWGDSVGKLYVTEMNGYVVRVISASKVVSKLAGMAGTSCSDSTDASGDGGQASAAFLKGPFSTVGDTAGNMYIADPTMLKIRQVTTSGIIKTIAGDGNPDYIGEGVATSVNVAAQFIFIDTVGSLYFTDNNACLVRKLSNSVVSSIVGSGYGFNGDYHVGTSTLLGVLGGLKFDSSSLNLYFVDAGNNRVRLMSTSNIIFTVAGSGSSTGSTGYGGAATAAAMIPFSLYGNTAGVLFTGSPYDNNVRYLKNNSPTVAPTAAPSHSRSSINTITTLMGTGSASSDGTGGKSTAASLNQPQSVFRDTMGTVYVAEFEGNCVRKFNTDDYIVVNVAGVCGSVFGDLTTTLATNAVFKYINDVVVDTTGVVYFSDYYGWAVRSVSNFGFLSVFAGSTEPATMDTGDATSIRCTYPYGLWIDSISRIYITNNLGVNSNNPYGCLVRRVTNGLSTVIVGTGVAGFSGDLGAATSATLNNPKRIFSTTTGYLFIADHDNYRVRMISLDGKIATVAGVGSGSYSGENIVATSASLFGPNSVAVDTSNGDTYVVCDVDRRIMVFTKTLGTMSTFAGSGVAPNSASDLNGDGGAATAALINMPSGIYLDSTNTLYFADYGNNKMRSVSYFAPTSSPSRAPTMAPSIPPSQAPSAAPSHARSVYNTINTLMGTGAASSDGTGGRSTAVAMNQPESVFKDTMGTIFVSEFSGNCVRKFSSSDYLVVNVAGVCATGGSSGTTIATNALLRSPLDVVVDTTGVVYFTEYYAWAVRSVSTQGILSVFAGSADATSLSSGPATSIGFTYPYGLWLDSIGQFYVACNVESSSSTPYTSFVRRIVSGVSTVIAGTGVPSFSGDLGPATSATLHAARRVFSATTGLLYIADHDNYRVRVVTVDGKISTVAGSGSGSYNGENLPATSVSFNAPNSVTVDTSNGDTYIAVDVDRRIMVLTKALGTISTFAGSGGAPAHAYELNGDGGAATAALLNLPSGLFLDTSDTLYIMDADNYKLRTVSYVAPTASPTGAPTVIPTNAPTCTPSRSPTISPTMAPSYTPVAAPLQYTITNYAGVYGFSGFGVDGVQATSTYLYSPWGICVTTTTARYIADYSNSRIRRVGSNGIITTVVGTGVDGTAGNGGPATSAQVSGPQDVYMDSLSNLYVLGSQTIRMVNSLQIITNVIGTLNTASNIGTDPNGDGGPATSATINFPYGFSGDTLGSIYIADSLSAKIRKVSNGIIFNIAGSGSLSSVDVVDGSQATSVAVNRPFKVFVDTSGSFFFVDFSLNLARKVTASSLISTVAGVSLPSGGFNGDGKAATATAMYAPRDLWRDTLGNTFISDYGNERIRLFSSSNNLAYTIAGTGVSGFSGDNGPATAALVSQVWYLTGNTAGLLYLSDHAGSTIRKLINTTPTVLPTMSPSVLPSLGPTSAPSYTPVAAPVQYTIIAFAGAYSYCNYGATVTQATSASLYNPWGINADTSGTVYFADNGYSRVRKVASDGITTTVAGTGADSASGNGGPATSASLSNPVDVWADSVSNLFILGGQTIRQVNSLQIITTVVGTQSTPSSVGTDPNGDGGPATSATIDSPYGFSGDTLGNIYIADTDNCKIRKVSNGIISTIAGTGTISNAAVADGSKATSVAFSRPFKPCVDTAGNIFIGDYYLGVVRAISASSIVTTVAGVSSTTGSFNGDGNAATSTAFNTLRDVWRDSLGNIFISDYGNERIRLIPSGNNIVYTIAGTGGNGLTGDNGAATAALISQVWYLAGNSNGMLFLSDHNGCLIRKLINTTPTITPTVAPSKAPTATPSYFPVASPSQYLIMASAGISGYRGYISDGVQATSTGLNQPYGICMDTTGVLYVSDRDSNRVRKVTTDGIIATVIGNGAGTSTGDNGPVTSATVYGPIDTWVDSTGRVFVMSAFTKTIRMINTAQIITTVVGSGAGSTTATDPNGDGGQATAATLALAYGFTGDTAGNLFIADTFNAKIRKASGGVITTVAGTGNPTYTVDGLAATSVNIYRPFKVFIDSTNSYYVSDYSVHQVRKISASFIVTTFVGVTGGGYNGDGVRATASALYNPLDAWFDSLGNGYVVDSNNHRIRLVSASDNLVYTVAGSGTNGNSGNGGSATAASLLIPWYLAGNSAGVVHTSDYTDNSVRKLVNNAPTRSPTAVPTAVPSSLPVVAPSKYLIYAFAGVSGSNLYGSDSVPAVSTYLNYNYGLLVDSANVVYIADYGNNRIRKVATDGIITTTVGDGVYASTGDGTPASSSSLKGPIDLWFDSVGRCYIANYDGQVIRRVDSSLIISTLAGTGNISPSPTSINGDGGAATSATFKNPFGIVGDSLGNVYISDVSNSKIRKIYNGIITTFAGKGTSGYAGDGMQATAVSFNTPFKMFIDSAGSMFVSDYDSNAIRKIASNTVVTTVTMVSSNLGFNGDGLPVSSTMISSPRGIWCDTVGNMHFADGDNRRIRLITAVSGIVYTIVGTGAVGSSGNSGPATSALLYTAWHLDSKSGILYVSDFSTSTVRQLINVSPTVLPTVAPSCVPSVSPTTSPSAAPSVVPSLAPTYAPYAAPTQYLISAYAGKSGTTLYNADGIQATSAGMNPHGVFMSTSGVLYLADYSSNRVRKVATNGIITTLIGNGDYDSSGDGGPASSATVYGPVDMWVDSTGRVLLLSYQSVNVRMVSTSLTVTLIAGSGAISAVARDANGDGGPPTSATFSSPYGITGNTAGDLFIADTNDGKIRKISNGIISTFAGTGLTSSYAGDGYYATSVTLEEPFKVFLDTSGNYFVSARTRSNIRKISPASIMTTVAGISSSGFNGDGLVATATQLYRPSDVWCDSLGIVYFFDEVNYRARMISGDNKVSTIAGTGGTTASGNNGAATAASFVNPLYLTGDSSGSIYVGDRADGTVRKLTVLVPSVAPTVSPTQAPSFAPAAAPTQYLITAYAGKSGTNSYNGDSRPASSAYMNQPHGVFVDSTGVVFMSDFSNARIRKVNSGIITTVAGGGLVDANGGPATSVYLVSPIHMWLDSTGKMFILDYATPTVRLVVSGIIYEFAGTGDTSTNPLAANGDGGPCTAATFNQPHGITGDTVGNVYIADTNNWKIRLISLGIITTVVGIGNYGSNADGVKATATSMRSPASIRVDSTGSLYFAESGNHIIRRVSSSSIVTTIVGSYTSGFNGDGLAATSSFLDSPFDAWYDSANILYVVDSSNRRVRMVVSASTLTYTIAGNGASSTSGNDGAATSAGLNVPTNGASNSAGALFISDYLDGTVRQLLSNNPTASPTTMTPTVLPSAAPSYSPVASPTKFLISAFAGISGTSGYFGDGGMVSSAKLNQPFGLSTDAIGGVYVADLGNARIRKAVGGSISTVAGSGSVNSNGGPATSTTLMSPISVWVDSVSKLYILGCVNSVIRVVDGGIISAFAGTGTTSTSALSLNGDGGPSTSATFYEPLGIGGDTLGNIFVADYNNQRIRMISLGLITSVVGTGTYGFYADGAKATSASLRGPSSARVDSTGSLYFSECGNSIVRKVTSSSILVTIAGSTAGFNGDGLAATASSLNAPYDAVYDTTYTLYLIDVNNRRVRMVSSSSGLMYTVAGNGGSTASGNNGAATAAGMNTPKHIATDSVGVLYFSDFTDGTVRKLVNTNPTVSPTVVPSQFPSILPTGAPSYTPVVAPTQYLISAYAGISGTSAFYGDGGPATSAQLSQPYGVATDTTGVLYLADFTNSRIRKVVVGIISTVAGGGASTSNGGPATSAVLVSPVDLWIDSTGKMYVIGFASTTIRMVVGGVIYEFAGTGSSSTNSMATNGDGGPCTSASFNLPLGISGDSTGKIYIADSNNKKIRMISLGIISTVVGSGNYGFDTDGAKATAIALRAPTSARTDPTGALYYCENENNLVRKMSSSSSIVTTLAGIAYVVGFNGDGLAATSSSLNSPYDALYDTANTMYIVDSTNRRIRMIVPTSTLTYTVAGNGQSGTAGNNGAATASGLNFARNIAFDTAGTVFFSDFADGTVRKLNNLNPTVAPSPMPSIIPTRMPSAAPSVLPTIAPSYAPVLSPSQYIVNAFGGTSGIGGNGGNGGPASAASLSSPMGLFVTTDGTLYIATIDGNMVRSVSPSGIIKAFAGTGSASSSGNGGAASSAAIYNPKCVWVDTMGQVFITEAGVKTIRNVVSGIIHTYVGTGSISASSTGANGDDGTATAATLTTPCGVFGDSVGSIYFTDTGELKIRTVDADGIISTLAGRGTNGFSGDNGPSTSSTMGYNNGLFVDSVGSVYFTDTGNGRVRVISPSRIITSVVGTGSIFNGDGQVATSTGVNSPEDVWADVDGNLFVVEFYFPRVRMVSASSRLVYTAAGSGSSIASGNGGAATAAGFASLAAIRGTTTGNVYVTDLYDGTVRILSSTVTQSPTVTPSTVPSLNPTVIPSVLPSTFIPTLIPSVSPTQSPSSLTPTRKPTAIPTFTQVSAPTQYLITAFAGISGPATSSDGDGGPATSAHMRTYGIAVDSVGAVYITEDTNNKVRKVSVGGIIIAVAGTGTAGVSGDGGPATSATLSTVEAVWVDSLGKIYILGYLGTPHRLVSGGIISVFAGTSTISGTSTGGNGDGGPATSATFNRPYGIFGDTVDNIYIADTSNFKVRLISGGIISTVAGTGINSYSADGLPATSSSLQYPFGIALDSTGKLIVTENGNHVIRSFAVGGILSTVTGKATAGFNGDGLAATASYISNPCGLWQDSTGNLFIADAGNNRVRTIPSASTLMYTIAGTGTIGGSGNNGPATAATFAALRAAVGDTTGVLYLSDNGDSTVRRLLSLAPTVAPTVTPTTPPSCMPSVQPSQSPTVTPSVIPSAVPVLTPSTLPTISPTCLPSIGPTVSPSGSPSVGPSVGPTVSPTVGPSNSPSFAPSTAPSLLPTLTPTLIPTEGPSIGPTLFPTVTPSTLPTSPPTCKPSLTPTVKPSFLPNNEPTIKPSLRPTAAASVLPTRGPSLAPTVAPSLVPSRVPTLSPTEQPSQLPSQQPSSQPSAFPSSVPTCVPLSHPTSQPTSQPVSGPSSVPSNQPTVQPSGQPTAQPSGQPILHPTAQPSCQPTSQPSSQPSDHPSDCPTSNPRAVPSSTPTMAPLLPTPNPTLVPSILPSVVPSIGPSLIPSVKPTRKPTIEPTEVPTRLPTVGPSIAPSRIPSVTPSLSPSLLPSTGPSISPSLVSSAPVFSQKPTTPTLIPTLSPSRLPTVKPSRIPVQSPTVKPTPGPSVKPSLKPSRIPSVSPSQKPSVIPSMKPSALPSVKPTVRPSVAPTTPTLIPTLPRPSISPSPTVTPTVSIAPSDEPSVAPTVPPSESPTQAPSSSQPSMTPITIPSFNPSAAPTVLPSAVPSTVEPSASPSTTEYFVSHPKATLPSNSSITVSGVDSNAFKIVLPFLSMSSGANGAAFTDITLSFDSYGISYIVFGGLELPNSVAVAAAYSGAVGIDTVKRSVSVVNDVNGDGYSDLIIGDPYVGRCYVLFGNSLGLVGMTKGFTIFGEQDSDLTGWSVSGAGDVNNDTLSDIIVGAPAVNGMGAFYVIYGRRSNNFDVYLNNLTASQGFAMYGAQKSDYLGISVSNAGDVNRDGCDDVIVGAAITSLFSAGAAYVAYGGASLKTLTSIAQLTQGFKVFGVGFMYAGYAVSAAGDVNKDGFDDVLVGSNPQRAQLVPAAYLIYGSASGSSVNLNAMIAGQGVKIAGGGIVVSYAGDVNHDRFDDIMIGGSFTPVLDFGYVVFTNVSHLTQITSKPSNMPSYLPSFAPTVRPTSAAPSVLPSKLPSFIPTVRPSTPTYDPTEGASQPSSFPSAVPSLPTIEPTEIPSEMPSEKPSVEPSERPTENPTREPSELPTVTPSTEPSEVPSFIATVKPSAASPTVMHLTRAPFASPSALPTVTVTDSTVNYTVANIVAAVSLLNESKSYTNYVIDTSEKVMILNGAGHNKYTVLPNTNSDLTIVYFDQPTDLIDLTAFTSITQFSQLDITEGSVIITLFDDQMIHILNLHPENMKTEMFVFYVKPATDDYEGSETNKVMDQASHVVGLAIGCVAVAAVAVWLYRTYGRKKTPMEKLQDFVFYTIKTNLDGTDIIEKSSDAGDEEDQEVNSEEEETLALLTEQRKSAVAQFWMEDAAEFDGRGFSSGSSSDYLKSNVVSPRVAAPPPATAAVAESSASSSLSSFVVSGGSDFSINSEGGVIPRSPTAMNATVEVVVVVNHDDSDDLSSASNSEEEDEEDDESHLEESDDGEEMDSLNSLALSQLSREFNDDEDGMV